MAVLDTTNEALPITAGSIFHSTSLALCHDVKQLRQCLLVESTITYMVAAITEVVTLSIHYLQ